MNTFRKKIRLTLFIWIVFAFALGVLFLMEHNLFGVMLLVLLVLYVITGFFIIFLRCPYCYKPVTHNPINFLSVEMMMYAPWIPDNCSKCGFPLTIDLSSDVQKEVEKFREVKEKNN